MTMLAASDSHPSYFYLLNVGGNHWICTMSEEQGIINVYDSLYSPGLLLDGTVLQICNAQLHIQQQEDGNADCGTTINFATELCFTRSAANCTSVKFRQNLMRKHVQHCIKDKTMKVCCFQSMPLQEL